MVAQEQTLLSKKLSEYQQVVFSTIKNMIPDHEPRRHLYDLVLEYPGRGGKGFRPGLCIATCRAFGGSTESALNTAAALELLHNAFLIHDDIEDESELRRGKPTLHQAHGLGVAINVGDAMNVMSIKPLMQNLFSFGPAQTWEIFTEVEHLVRQTVEGQAIELGWIKENTYQIKEHDYLDMVLKKTCWYTTIHPIRLGALIAMGDAENLNQFNRFGYYMGAAFQIKDDLLNLIGDEDKYGKEIGGDILEGKRTLMLIHLFEKCTKSELKYLQNNLARRGSETDIEFIAWTLERMKHYGSIDYGIGSANKLAGAALGEYCRVFASVEPSLDKDLIEQLILYMVRREH